MKNVENTPRGIRNHNPGNIEFTGELWQGLAEPKDDGRFCRFVSPGYGIRAIGRILITYRDRYGINTIRAVIERWAPPSENNSDAYADHVAQKSGVLPDQVIDVTQYDVARALVEAIILHENGQQPYPPAVIDQGLRLAGIEARPGEVNPLTKSRTVKGGTVVAAGGVASVVSGIMDQAQPALPFLSQMMYYAPWAVGAIVLVGVVWMLWARYDDSRKGLR